MVHKRHRLVVWALVGLVAGLATAGPLSSSGGGEMEAEGERGPLGVVSELGQRLSHALVPSAPDARLSLPLPLPLPSSQDIDNIKKVAQILIMLGEQLSLSESRLHRHVALHMRHVLSQVIPALVGDAPPAPPAPAACARDRPPPDDN